MELDPLQLLWFVLLGILLAGYAILDGFDLGVGILHLFVRKDEDRRVLMNSIGPLWDGNEVWLVVFGGALFSAFPRAYSAAFSGLYTPLMLILAGLIFRGVSMEFRSKREMAWWRTGWDIAFSLASILVTFLFGVAVGNFMLGLPINADYEFNDAVPLTTLLRPYPIMTGLFAVTTFAMHGAIFLYLKTEGELQQRIHRWRWTTFALFLFMYLAVSIYTLTMIPRATAKYVDYPWAWSVPILNVLAIANMPRAIYGDRPFYAFFSSSCTIAAFTFLFGLTLFPNMIVSSLNSEWNLTVAKASSTDNTLAILAIVALLGMPFVLSYTAVVYWVFGGKTQLGKFSY
jgi:cytochrome bd ubiquinol oxidase subunit II